MPIPCTGQSSLAPARCRALLFADISKCDQFLLLFFLLYCRGHEATVVGGDHRGPATAGQRAPLVAVHRPGCKISLHVPCQPGLVCFLGGLHTSMVSGGETPTKIRSRASVRKATRGCGLLAATPATAFCVPAQPWSVREWVDCAEFAYDRGPSGSA